MNNSTECNFNVMVVDDDEGTVEIIAAFLGDLPGVKSLTYTSPQLSLLALETMPVQEFPQLIFTDIMMPECSGLDLVDSLEKVCLLRNINPPKVIFVSGRVEAGNHSDEVLSAIKSRGYQTLAKPFCMETIVQETERARTHGFCRR